MDKRLIAIVIAAPIIVGLAILLYTWPTARAAPRNVPVGLVAGATQVDSVAGRMGDQHGMFDVKRYDSVPEAMTGLRQREVTAVVVDTGATSQILYASAGGPAATMAVLPVLQTVAGSSAQATDVVPTPSTDPMGSVLSQAVLPLTLAGELSAIVLALAVRPGWRQLGPLTAVSAFTGLIAMLIIKPWLEVTGNGTWWIISGVIALNILAIGSIVLGLHAILGRIGLPIAFLVLVFLGNAWSGSSTSPYLLPTGVRRVGSWLPPGAGDQLLRSAAFFHGYGYIHPAVVLGVWVFVGFAAVLVGKVLIARRTDGQGRHERSGANAATAPAAG